MRLFTFFLLFLIPGLPAQTPLSAEVRAFLAWYESYDGSFYPQDVVRAYMAKLEGEGVPVEEGKRRVGAVQEALRGMPPEFVPVHFDKIYKAKERPFRTSPTEFLKRVLEGRKPGAALDVATGQGRNALYLAGQGWQVTGYDLSKAALAEAAAAAKSANLELRLLHCAHDDFDYGQERWDLIVEAYAFTDLTDDNYRRRVLASLKPGGLLVIEGFGGGGPKNLLIEAFRELRVLAYEDREEIADWGMQKSRVTRIAAERER